MPALPDVQYFAIVPKAPRREAIDHFVTWVRSLF
jgi:hypothetical protein